MVGTILPMVHGTHSFERIRAPLIVHTVGCIAGGASAGVLVSWIVIMLLGEAEAGSEASDRGLVLLSMICCVYGFEAARLLRVIRPQSTWQVPSQWTGWRSGTLTGLAYGLLLGMGCLTRMPAALYPVLVWIALIRRPVWCAIAMATFGAFRALPLWAIDLGCENAAQREHVARTLGHWYPAMRMVSGYALLFAGAMLASAVFYS
jgi:cytochrome c biogenesis protein CcdA